MYNEVTKKIRLTESVPTGKPPIPPKPAGLLERAAARVPKQFLLKTQLVQFELKPTQQFASMVHLADEQSAKHGQFRDGCARIAYQDKYEQVECKTSERVFKEYNIEITTYVDLKLFLNQQNIDASKNKSTTPQSPTYKYIIPNLKQVEEGLKMNQFVMATVYKVIEYSENDFFNYSDAESIEDYPVHYNNFQTNETLDENEDGIDQFDQESPDDYPVHYNNFQADETLDDYEDGTEVNEQESPDDYVVHYNTFQTREYQHDDMDGIEEAEKFEFSDDNVVHFNTFQTADYDGDDEQEEEPQRQFAVPIMKKAFSYPDIHKVANELDDQYAFEWI